MKIIEQNLKDLCKKKGLSLTDVANRMGTSPSNLLSSVKGNPTVSKLQDIADALQVNLSELITMRPGKAHGIAIIDGISYPISMPTAYTVQLPQYSRYDALRDDIKAFVENCIKEENTTSMMGMVETMEVFALVYDRSNEIFFLSICYADGKMFTCTYDKLEFASWGEEDNEESASWCLDVVIQEIINDVEGIVLQKKQV